MARLLSAVISWLSRHREEVSWAVLLVPSVGLVCVVYFTSVLHTKAEESDARWRIYRDAINRSGISLVMVDEDRVITEWNLGAEKMFGYTSKEAEGSNIKLIIPDRFQPAHDASFERSIFEGVDEDDKVYNVECIGKKKNGEEIPISIKLKKVQWGLRVRYLAIATTATNVEMLPRAGTISVMENKNGRPN